MMLHAVQKKKTTSGQLKLENVGGIFVLLLCGLILGVVCLGTEMLWINVTSSKQKRKTNGQ